MWGFDEIARTIRSALRSWGHTTRLCMVVCVITANGALILLITQR
jgi:hypothetical protein